VTKRARKLEVASTAAPLTTQVTPRAAPLPDARVADAPLGAPSSRPSPSSTLAEQNNLFVAGMLARRNGQLRRALDQMQRLLADYPTSHLAENAAAERMRLLTVLDPARAPLAAREYLSLYPTGFARAEAESILAANKSMR